MQLKLVLNEKTICSGLGCILMLMLVMIVVIFVLSNMSVTESFNNPNSPNNDKLKTKMLSAIKKKIEKFVKSKPLTELQVVNLEKCTKDILERLDSSDEVINLLNAWRTYDTMKDTIVKRSTENILLCSQKPVPKEQLQSQPVKLEGDVSEDGIKK